MEPQVATVRMTNKKSATQQESIANRDHRHHEKEEKTSFMETATVTV